MPSFTRALSENMYAKCIKRCLDFLFSTVAFVVLSPLILLLTVTGALAMRANPFFVQPRPGKNEKIFKLIKFRSMNNRKDDQGQLLPSKERLTRYGVFLRKTSLDELPELLNIIRGDLALVGPRPLLVKYLPLYNEQQRRRHEVRPGLTGYAQVNGRNSLSWEEKFRLDVEYVDNITFSGDVRIIFQTVKTVLKRDGIEGNSAVIVEEFKGSASLQSKG